MKIKTKIKENAEVITVVAAVVATLWAIFEFLVSPYYGHSGASSDKVIEYVESHYERQISDLMVEMNEQLKSKAAEYEAETKKSRDQISEYESSYLSLNLALTADIYNLASIARQEMKAKTIKVFVMDIQTGGMKAIVNNHEQKLNYAQRDVAMFEPGSIMKSIAFAYAYERGLVNEHSTVDARTPLKAAGFTINDFHAKKAILTLPEAYIYSSNIAAAKLSDYQKPKQYFNFLKKVGITERIRSPFHFSEFIQPITPKSPKEINAITASYGHGVLTSAYHIIGFYGAVGADGIKRTPSVFTSKSAGGQRVFAANTARQILDLMKINVRKGSGRKVQFDDLEVAGKTGTAEKVVNGRYSSAFRLNSFVGIVPADRPRFVVLTIVDEPECSFVDAKNPCVHAPTAGVTAAPLTKQVIETLRVRYNF